MKLVVLGSGTSVPHATRSSAAHWLETDAGTLLLDISPDASHRMAQEGLTWFDLDAVWVSHFHLDHVGGLAPYLFGLKWAPQTTERNKPLRIYGPKGLEMLFNTINDSGNYRLLSQRFPLELIEVTPDEDFEILPGLSTTTFSTTHTKESLAIRLTDKRAASLVYTSDTGYSEQLTEFAAGTNLLLVECSFRKDKPQQTHLELADVMQLARAAEPKTVVLTHLYPEWDGVDIAAEARGLWQGEVIVAVDGLRIEF